MLRVAAHRNEWCRVTDKRQQITRTAGESQSADYDDFGSDEVEWHDKLDMVPVDLKSGDVRTYAGA